MKGEMKMKMKRTVLLLGIAGILLAAMISPAAASLAVSVDDTPEAKIVPGGTYIAYNITCVEDGSDSAATTLNWFNISDWNRTFSTFADLDDIANISLWNASAAPDAYLGHNSSITGFTISVPLTGTISANATAVINVSITLKTTGLIDGRNIVFNATLKYDTSNSANANDTAAETIEVLDATAGPSEEIAWEGDKNVLCANVTIYPGNTTAPQYLKKITFNNTATAPRIDLAYIESFGLWNDTNANKTFDAGDTLISSSTPTEGSNVTFDLTDLTTDNRTIAGTKTFFLTMNITPVAHTGKYQAQIFEQNITINQTAGEGNTGNDTATKGFTTLWIDPVDIYVYDSPEDLVSPGKSYIAYNVTFVANKTDPAWTNLSWFNITGMNQTFTNLGDVYDIANVSVILNTTGANIVNYSASGVPNPATFPIAVNLSDTGTGNDSVNTTVILSVNLTINNSAPIDPWDGTNISINASLYAWGNTTLSPPWTWGTTNNTNDPAPELIAYESVTDPTDAVITWNGTTYYPDSVAGISVFDPDYDTLNSKQTIVVRAWTDTAGNATSGYEEVELAETGVTSGRFNGSVAFDPIADSHAKDVLAVRDGDQIYVQMKDNQNQEGVVAYREETAWFNFTRTGTVALNESTYNTSQVAKVTMKDKDENTDSTSIETINVNVNSSTDLTGLTLALTETTISSGKFEGTFDFTTTGASSGTTLQVTRNARHTVNETINVTYYDKVTANGPAENITDDATFYGLWTGSVSLNQTVYLDGQALNVTLYDPDLNTNISATDWVLNASNYTIMFINTTNLSAYSEKPGNYDSENITNITETGADTGYFTNTTITLNATTGVYKDNGELNVTPGGSFAVVYFDFSDEYGDNSSEYATSGWVNKSTANATASTLETAAVSVWWNKTGNITGTAINVTSDNVWGRDTVARISIDDADGGGIDLTDAPDNITVNVNSTEDPTGIDINLTETGATTGVFNGTLKFTSDTSDATIPAIKVNSSDSELVNTMINVNFNDTTNATQLAEWMNVSFTHRWTVNGTAKVWNGTVNGTVDVPAIFYNTTTATVYVNDPDRNNDTTTYNMFNVTIWNGTTDTLEITLNETTNNSEVFYGTFNFSEAGAVDRLNVSDGCKIYINYSDTNTSLGNVSTWFNYTYGTYKKTRTGTVDLWELNPVVGESGNITLDDYDRNVTAGYDTVNVTVWSNTSQAEAENKTITVTLNQTSPTAETFNGTLRFSTAETNASNNQIKVSDGDNITIRYVDALNISGLQETITISPLPWVSVYYTGNVTFNKTRYNPAETALIRLTDKDLNTSTGIEEYNIVNVTSTSDQTGFNITVRETGDTTGIFEGTIIFKLGGPSDAAANQLNVSIGGIIYANYSDANNETGDSQLISDTAMIVKATADTLDLDSKWYNLPATATVTLSDSDRNNVTDAVETLTNEISVNSSSDLSGISVSVTETGANTGNFAGTFSFSKTESNDPADILRVSTNDTINVSYYNAANKTNKPETLLETATFDDLVPAITNLSADVSPAKENDVVQITVDVSDNISGVSANPTTTVNGNDANYVSVSNNTYTYNYTVTVNDTEGNATVNVSATDNATNVATNSTTLFVIDLSAPTFSGWTPAESTVVEKNTTISVNYTDAYSSINTSSVVMKVNGVTANVTATATGVSYDATNLPSGANNASVYVEDELGHANETLWNFTVDETAPRITNMIPDKTNDTTPTIGATIYDNETGVNASTIVLKVDGNTISSDKYTFNATSGELRYTPTVSYGEGPYPVELSVRDNAGLSASASWQFTVDLTNPTVSVGVDKATVNVSENATITVTATDTVTAAESMTVTVTVDTTSVELTRDGSNWTGVFANATPATYTVTAKATDEAGNSDTATTTVVVKEVAVPALTVTANVTNVTVNTPTAVEFNVTSDGEAVGDAFVSVSQAGTELINGTTEAGLVTLSVNATSEDTINVTATKTGYTSNTTTIEAITGLPKTGDMDGSGGDLNMQDVILLARHVLISPTEYPLYP